MNRAILFSLLLVSILAPVAAWAAEPLKASWPEQMAAAYRAAHDEIAAGVQLDEWYARAPIQVKGFADNPIAIGPPDLKAAAGQKPLWEKWPIAMDWFNPPQMPQGHVLYFTRKVTAAKPVSITLSLCGADGIEGWLDGKSFIRHDVKPAAPADLEQVKLALTPGDHWLIFKVYKSTTDPKFRFISIGVMDPGFANRFRSEFPYPSDWFMQDCVRRNTPATDNDDFCGDLRDYLAHQGTQLEQTMIGRALAEIGADATSLQGELNQLVKAGAAPDNAAWLTLYEKACWQRRQIRLRPLLAKTKSVIFAKHQVFASRAGIYLHTEYEGCPAPSSLFQIDLAAEKAGTFAPHSILYDAKDGIARDPELSFDADKLLFASRPTRNDLNDNAAPKTGNYQIYEMDLATRQVRQLTTDETYGASFEPCYLPSGDILFSSSRIVQHITCGWGDCSNLFIMNKDGKYARRVGFDQTQTAFPTLLEDGRVIYTRRDYNDRGQSAAHALFVMNADGTYQTEMYGNQTGTPNSFQHSRGIPGSRKILTILGGYHTTQGGKLAIMDVSLGRQKDQGLIQIPDNKKPPCGDGPDDGYGKGGVQYCNPYPLGERELLVSRSSQSREGYGVYFMTVDGRRELLACDGAISCLQPIPLMARPRPPVRATSVDYRKKDGVVFLQDVYNGPAVDGVPRGSIKKIRVIELLYKTCTIGASMGSGPGGAVHSVTTPSNPIGGWEVKRILGDATVYPDGSAMFRAPARRPFFFQLLDEKNRVIQTMRSWAVLMPNEHFSCVGCHEKKTETPAATAKLTQAMQAGIEELKPFYGEPVGFSYRANVQPIFDKHCVSCHNADGKAKKLVLTAEPMVVDNDAQRKFCLSFYNLTKARPGPNPAAFNMYNQVWKREGAAQADEPNRYVTYLTRFELMKAYPPYRAGAVASGMIKLLEKGHNDVKLSPEEWDKLCAWIDLNIPYCGSYDEAWTDGTAKTKDRIKERQRNEAIDDRNVAQYIRDGQP